MLLILGLSFASLLQFLCNRGNHKVVQLSNGFIKSLRFNALSCSVMQRLDVFGSSDRSHKRGDSESLRSATMWLAALR